MRPRPRRGGAWKPPAAASASGLGASLSTANVVTANLPVGRQQRDRHDHLPAHVVDRLIADDGARRHVFLDHPHPLLVRPIGRDGDGDGKVSEAAPLGLQDHAKVGLFGRGGRRRRAAFAGEAARAAPRRARRRQTHGDRQHRPRPESPQ